MQDDVTLESLLGDINIDYEDINLKDQLDNIQNHQDWIKQGHMLEVLLFSMWTKEEEYDNEPGTHKHKAFINLLKLIQLEVMRDPYWNSRFGWMIWWLSCYAKYDSYYPLQWCYHFDPLNFYRVGEPVRPDGVQLTEKDDPFNCKGYQVSNEWWKKGCRDVVKEGDECAIQADET